MERSSTKTFSLILFIKFVRVLNKYSIQKDFHITHENERWKIDCILPGNEMIRTIDVNNESRKSSHWLPMEKVISLTRYDNIAHTQSHSHTYTNTHNLFTDIFRMMQQARLKCRRYIKIWERNSRARDEHTHTLIRF